MNLRTTLFIAVIAAGAAVVSAVALSVSPPQLSVQDLVGWAVFVGLGLLSEGMAVTFSAGKRDAKSSVLFLPLFACAISFEPSLLVLAVLIILPVSELLFFKPIPWRAVFNTAQLTLCFGTAAIVYHALAAENESIGAASIGPFLVMVGVNFVLNTVIVTGFMAVRAGEPFFAMFKRVVGPSAANLFYDFLASPIALVAAILYQELYITGVLLILLPLYLIRYSYISKVQLQVANTDLLKVLVIAIETRDPYTSGHSQRVSTLSTAIAADLNCSARFIRKLERAALLHDIGKIDARYSELISKPHDLTPEERELIKTHASRGAELLETLSMVERDVVLAVRHHHERWDGNGYPSGLRGEEIPLAARIIMLSDSIDAMLSDRPYRAALSIEDTEAELRRCAGSQFDPRIVEQILPRQTLQRAAAIIKATTTTYEDAGILTP
ncbi:MAG: HD-GYP domain-containing protein [Longimicrobiales bacterium]